MADREKVIAELANIANCLYPYIGGDQILACRDAITLLKEQEPIAPKRPKTVYAYEFACGNCDACIDIEWIVCPWCGKGIKWDEAD